MKLTRPCTNEEFRVHYAGATITVADYGYLIVTDENGDEIDVWSPSEQLPAAMRLALQPFLESPLFKTVSRLTSRPLTPSGITELRKGKRHKPSRYHY